MPRRLQLESNDYFQLEDGSGFILLEEDWELDPGSGSNSWAPASDANSPTWTPVPGSGGQSWDREDGS